MNRFFYSLSSLGNGLDSTFNNLGSVYMEKIASASRGYFPSRDIGILYKLM